MPTPEPTSQAHDVVLLTVEPRVVATRLRDTTRPLLQGEDPIAAWTRISEQRAPLYAEVADATFDTSSGPLSDVASAIVAWARARSDRPERTHA